MKSENTYNIMASQRVAMAWGILILLVLLFPTFNDTVHTIASDVGATPLEASLPNWIILVYIIVTFGSFGFTFYYTVEELE